MNSAAYRTLNKVSLLPRSAGRVLLTAVLVVTCAASGLWAQGPRDYRSKNFLLHSDLSEDEAKELLTDLETMLSLISRYWGKPNRQVIEMFVAKDVRTWPREVLQQMDGDGVTRMFNGAGVTVGRSASVGGQRVTKSTVYCVADRGVPKHEAVHAYCQQAFGTTGPLWYSEGMAEMGQYWRTDDHSVNCEDYVLDYLRRVQPKSLNDIVNPATEITGDSWQNYAWRWALCHLLANNTNYQARFRPLGMAYLTKQNMTFEQIYGPMADEIIFEYLFFLNHMKRGYRADLCSWDWGARFNRPLPGRTTKAKINANAGWQPTKMLVEAGKKYDFTAPGQWKLAKDGDLLTADGGTGGKGRLMGVIFSDYKLSEPFELGSYGTFEPPSEGQLWLRCGDDWGSLADNDGQIEVTLKLHGTGEMLARPGDSPSSSASSASAGSIGSASTPSPGSGSSGNSGNSPGAGDAAKATSKLRLGKLLLTRDLDRAKTYLQEAIELAPRSDAADEARKLLKGL